MHPSSNKVSVFKKWLEENKEPIQISSVLVHLPLTYTPEYRLWQGTTGYARVEDKQAPENYHLFHSGVCTNANWAVLWQWPYWRAYFF